MNVTFSVDISGISRKLNSLKADVKEKAVPRALNKVAAQAKTQASRAIRSGGLNVKVGEIKGALKIYKASPGRLVATVTASGKKTPMIQFSAVAARGGVSVNVKRGRELLPDAFIQFSGRLGRKAVFKRTGGSKTGKRKALIQRRYPIKELYGPSIADEFATSNVQSSLDQFVREKFESILRHEMGFLSSR